MHERVFHFDRFEVDTFRHEVRQGGELVPLQRKPCELLVLLVANHDRLVTREEITSELWGEGRFIDAERSINTAVRKIRSALGDDPDESRFIRTVVGKGYQFVAPVEEVIREPMVVPQVAHSESPSAPVEQSLLAVAPPMRSRRWLMAALLALVVVTLGAGFFVWSRSRPALTEQDTILIPAFANTTGDPVFDLTLRQGLAAQLEQSPLLGIFPEERMRETLRMMRLSPDATITREVAREICQRQGLKAWISGSIARLGSHYAITLEATDSGTGDSLALVQVEASSKEHVLEQLSKAASQMRRSLGESVRSLQKFDALLQHTTSSIEALRAYSLGTRERQQGNTAEAITLYRQAIEIDPNFSSAYAALAALYSNTRQRGLAAEYATKAYQVRDHASERERLLIQSLYYGQVTGELEKRIGILRLHQQSYPRDSAPHSNLATTFNSLGRFDQAVEESRTAIRLSPTGPAKYAVLGTALMRLSRLSEAESVYRSALALNLDSPSLHQGLFRIAFVKGDATEMAKQIEWAGRKKMEYAALDWQAEAAAALGQQRKSFDYSVRASAAAARTEAADLAAEYLAYAALRAAVFGSCEVVGPTVAKAIAVESNPVSLTRSAVALAWCGDSAGATRISNDLMAQHPKHTVVTNIWLPLIRATSAWRTGHPESVVELLKPADSYEAAAEHLPQYVRGQAYLALGKGREAELEFRKILEHREQDPLSPLFPLARLALAEAELLKGSAPEARKDYDQFRAHWTGADADLPLLVESRKRFERQ